MKPQRRIPAQGIPTRKQSREGHIASETVVAVRETRGNDTRPSLSYFWAWRQRAGRPSEAAAGASPVCAAYAEPSLQKVEGCA